MERVLIIDYSKCVGCKTCEMVCSLSHEGICSSSLSRIRVAKDERAGWFVPVSCSMCEKAMCVAVCPAGAMVRNLESGVVTVNEQLCIGCRQCVMACPFGHANFNPVRKVAFKCDQCGGEPQCASFCWTGAIIYDELERVLEQKRLEAAERAVRQ